jgi:hypothetical protein
METILIEEYRGYSIVYNKNKETFQSDISESKPRGTASSCREDIDDYIKANQEFKPFEAVNINYLVLSFYGNDIGKAFSIVKGLRKDNALQCERGQITNYDLEVKYYKGCDWYVCNIEEKESVLKSLRLLDKERIELNDKLKDIEKMSRSIVEKLKGESLAEFRDRLIKN